MDPFGSGKRGEQHNPAAHARPDKDLPALGQRIDDRNRILGPPADRAQRKIAARSAMAEIVEAHIRIAATTAEILEKRRFGARHVGAESAEKNEAGGCARQTM